MEYNSPFVVSYVGGGVIDKVRELPYPHFSQYETPFVKGRRVVITQNTTVDTYSLPYPAEFLSIAFAASSYTDSDNWDLFIGDVQICQSIYAKGLPESVSMGNSFGIVYPIPANTPIKFVFKTSSPKDANENNKVVRYNIKFLRNA